MLQKSCMLFCFIVMYVNASINGSWSCESKNQHRYKDYFKSMKLIYNQYEDGTCLPVQSKCGWEKINSKLPLYVLVVGLEGSGHHLWSKLLAKPVVDCVWVNARHYDRDINDGVPKKSGTSLSEGIKAQFAIRMKTVGSLCKLIVNTEDSFPTGALRKPGRLFMRPDIVNLQEIDGQIMNVKYIVMVRNSTETVLSAMRRNFVTSLDQALHLAEHTMTYIESALRGVPCERVFIAHYEHILSRPMDYVEPLTEFLQLSDVQSKNMASRIKNNANDKKSSSHGVHDLTNYEGECSSQMDKDLCYRKIFEKSRRFLNDRNFMWPTFAGNGKAVESKK